MYAYRSTPYFQAALNSLQGENIDDKVDATLDRLLVAFGCEILKIVPGKVSTEVDARFSFDTKESVNKALHIIDVRGCSSPLRDCR
jgi:transaldolase